MATVEILFHGSEPVAVYRSSSDALKAIHDLPGCFDPHLCLLSVPYEPSLVASGDAVMPAPAVREPRASGAAAAAAVTLSPNGNKKE